MSKRFISGFLGFAVLAGAASTAEAQTTATPPPAQQQPAAPAQPAEPAIGFTSDAGMMFNMIKASSVADFEMVLGKLKEALQKSEDPQRKQQAASWKIYKSTDGAQAVPCPDGTQCQAVMYIFVFDKTVKGVDYDPVKILSEAYPTEVNALYEKLKAAYVTLNKSSVSMLMDMSMAGMVEVQNR